MDLDRQGAPCISNAFLLLLLLLLVSSKEQLMNSFIDFSV